MIGRRLPDRNEGEPGARFAPGDYQKQPNGTWLARPPLGHLGDLRNHDITEHEDGTITVARSIRIIDTPGVTQWHGYLERGVWREC